MEILSTQNIKKLRKFNSQYRKKLITKLNKLFECTKNKENSFNIYNIINEDIGTNFSTNRNGIFINMNILSDNCIQKLTEYIDSINKDSSSIILSETENQIVPEYKAYKIDEIEYISNMGTKLSNQEKHIIKRIRNKEI
jgi:hypothetical protein